MANNTVYSFDDVAVTFIHPAVGQISLSGQGTGSINVVMQTDKTTHDVAADGSVMISKVPGDNAQIEIEVQQTSEAHSWFTKYYNIVNIGLSELWAQGLITIEAPGSITTLTDVSPLKRADKPYREQGQRVTWTFMAALAAEF